MDSNEEVVAMITDRDAVTMDTSRDYPYLEKYPPFSFYINSMNKHRSKGNCGQESMNNNLLSAHMEVEQVLLQPDQAGTLNNPNQSCALKNVIQEERNPAIFQVPRSRPNLPLLDTKTTHPNHKDDKMLNISPATFSELNQFFSAIPDFDDPKPARKDLASFPGGYILRSDEAIYQPDADPITDSESYSSSDDSGLNSDDRDNVNGINHISDNRNRVPIKDSVPNDIANFSDDKGKVPESSDIFAGNKDRIPEEVINVSEDKDNVPDGNQVPERNPVPDRDHVPDAADNVSDTSTMTDGESCTSSAHLRSESPSSDDEESIVAGHTESDTDTALSSCNSPQAHDSSCEDMESEPECLCLSHPSGICTQAILASKNMDGVNAYLDYSTIPIRNVDYNQSSVDNSYLEYNQMPENLSYHAVPMDDNFNNGHRMGGFTETAHLNFHPRPVNYNPGSMNSTHVEYSNSGSVTSSHLEYSNPGSVTSSNLEYSNPGSVTSSHMEYISPGSVSSSHLEYSNPGSVTSGNIDNRTSPEPSEFGDSAYMSHISDSVGDRTAPSPYICDNLPDGSSHISHSAPGSPASSYFSEIEHNEAPISMEEDKKTQMSTPDTVTNQQSFTDDLQNHYSPAIDPTPLPAGHVRDVPLAAAYIPRGSMRHAFAADSTVNVTLPVCSMSEPSSMTRGSVLGGSMSYSSMIGDSMSGSSKPAGSMPHCYMPLGSRVPRSAANGPTVTLGQPQSETNCTGWLPFKQYQNPYRVPAFYPDTRQLQPCSSHAQQHAQNNQHMNANLGYESHSMMSSQQYDIGSIYSFPTRFHSTPGCYGYSADPYVTFRARPYTIPAALPSMYGSNPMEAHHYQLTTAQGYNSRFAPHPPNAGAAPYAYMTCNKSFAVSQSILGKHSMGMHCAATQDSDLDNFKRKEVTVMNTRGPAELMRSNQSMVGNQVGFSNQNLRNSGQLPQRTSSTATDCMTTGKPEYKGVINRNYTAALNQDYTAEMNHNYTGAISRDVMAASQLVNAAAKYRSTKQNAVSPCVANPNILAHLTSTNQLPGMKSTQENQGESNKSSTLAQKPKLAALSVDMPLRSGVDGATDSKIYPDSTTSNPDSKPPIKSGTLAEHTNLVAIRKKPVFESVLRKPKETYMVLIAQAILASQNAKASLSDIYEHIMLQHAFYRDTSLSWKNAVRHNLSTNECFVKAGRMESGRGYYWGIHPSCEASFKKGVFDRRQARRKAQHANRERPTTAPANVFPKRPVVPPGFTHYNMIQPYLPRPNQPYCIPAPLP